MKRKQYLQNLSLVGVKQLLIMRNEEKQKLFQLKIQHANNPVANTSDFKLIRRNIARINTILSYKITTLYGSSMK